jgi:hypothetical protein
MSDLSVLTDPDEEITRNLRAIYAAPAGHAYWNDLEARIMARVAEVELGWWDVLDRWAKPAMVLAAGFVLAAGYAMYHAQEREAAAAYHRIFEPPPIPDRPVDDGLRTIDQDPKEKTLRFIFEKNRH